MKSESDPLLQSQSPPDDAADTSRRRSLLLQLSSHYSNRRSGSVVGFAEDVTSFEPAAQEHQSDEDDESDEDSALSPTMLMLGRSLSSSKKMGLSRTGSSFPTTGIGAGGGLFNLLEVLCKNVVSGLIASFLGLMFCLSWVTITFSGVFMSLVPLGIEMSSISCVVGTGIAIFLSQFPYITLTPDLLTAVFMKGLGAELEERISDDNVLRATLIWGIICSTVALGLGFIIVAPVQSLAGVLPYPVLCGLLSSMGVQQLQAAWELATSTSAGFGKDACISLACMILFSLLNVAATMRGMSPLSSFVPLVLLSLGLFWVIWPLFGHPSSSSIYLFETSSGGFESLGSYAHYWLNIGLVRWDLLLESSAPIFSMLVLMVMKGVLAKSAIERAMDVKIDKVKEMRTFGIAVTLAGLSGGAGLAANLSSMLITKEMGGHARIPSLIATIFMASLSFGGMRVLSYCPRFILAGSIGTQGFSLVVTWLLRSKPRLALSEWLVVPSIVVLYVQMGMLPAIAIGAGVSLILNAKKIFDTGAIKYNASALIMRSSVERIPRLTEYLNDHGDEVQIVGLQSLACFANAFTIVDFVRNVLKKKKQAGAKVIILDMVSLIGLDSSAADSFCYIHMLCVRSGAELFISGASHSIQSCLRRGGMPQVEGGRCSTGSGVRIFADLDAALEAAEELLLEEPGRLNVMRQKSSLVHGFAACLQELQHRTGIDTSELAAFTEHCVVRDFGPGEVLLTGDTPYGEALDFNSTKYGLFFVEYGTICISRDPSGPAKMAPSESSHLVRRSTSSKHLLSATKFRLRQVGQGNIIGAHDFVCGFQTLGVCRAETPSRCWLLTYDKLTSLASRELVATLTLYKIIANLVAKNLDCTSNQLSSLKDSLYMQDASYHI
jgi:MFS superfamily sulfate permease-like transporter